MKKIFTRAFLSVTILSMVACSSPITTREKGAGIGVVGGAAAGGIIGSTVGHAGAGAGIGAIFGGILGWLFGDQMQKGEQLERENECLRNLRPGANSDLCKQN